MALEYINAVTFPCGCRFLLAWEETRTPNPQGRGWVDNLPPGQERQFRIVTRAEAEDVVSAKRAHPDWTPHVVAAGKQPEAVRCALHASVPNNKGGYQQVVLDNNPTP